MDLCGTKCSDDECTICGGERWKCDCEVDPNDIDSTGESGEDFLTEDFRKEASE